MTQPLLQAKPEGYPFKGETGLHKAVTAETYYLEMQHCSQSFWYLIHT